MNNDLKKALARHDALMDEVNRLNLTWLQAQGAEKAAAQQAVAQAQGRVNAHRQELEDAYPEAKKAAFWKAFYQTYRQAKEKADSQRVREVLLKDHTLLL